MKFVIQVNVSPNESNLGYSAYQFIKAALKMQHEIFRVFFYQDGIYHAFKYSTPPSDELQITKKWTQLAKEQGIDLVVCVSAAQRRGLLSAEEAKRQGKVEQVLAEGFRTSGLGQLVEANLLADRLIEFG